MYGTSFLTFNFHGILHYAEDARRHGPLTSNSAFLFESFNSKFCRFLRSRTHPLTEFANRYYETINVSFFCFSPVHANITTFVIERNLVEVVNVKDMVNDSILCRVYLNASHVYNLHCNSLLLSIMQFCAQNFREVYIARDRLVKKCIKVQHNEIVTCIPLLHMIV